MFTYGHNFGPFASILPILTQLNRDLQLMVTSQLNLLIGSSFGEPMCDIPTQGLIGLIGYSYQQVATFFLEADLQRTLRLSVLGLEQFGDG